MVTYKYNNELKLILPPDFIVSREENDNGDVWMCVQAEEFENDDGETAYHFSCTMGGKEVEYENVDERLSPEDLLKALFNGCKRVKYLMVPSTPASMIMSTFTPLSINDVLDQRYCVILAIALSETKIFSIACPSMFDDDEPDENVTPFDHVLTIAKAIRFEGKELSIGNLSPKKLAIVLEPSFDEDDNEPIDMSLGFAFSDAGRTVSNPATKTAAVSAPSGKKVGKNDCSIDYLGTLTAYNGNSKSIILPDGITSIGKEAFFGNNDITSVVIPEGVQTIEDGAFWMCSNLTSATLPSTVKQIGDNAFNSTTLTSIVIPDGCKKLGADCFTLCKKLKDIYVPDSVCEIGNDAFCTFNDATVIHTIRYSIADTFAEENGIKVDYISAP